MGFQSNVAVGSLWPNIKYELFLQQKLLLIVRPLEQPMNDVAYSLVTILYVTEMHLYQICSIIITI
jgi:hypothetical protein